MPDQLTPTDRTKVRRLPDRGSYERDLINAVIDEAYIAHVGFVVDGSPRVLPMTYGRDGDHLYLHGAVGNAMLRALTSSEVCVTITLLDGLVLARSAFHHSMNYRSVVLLGQPTKVEDEAAKRHAFDTIVEHVLPGRSTVARPTNASELRTTLVLRLDIAEGSAKVRTRRPHRRRRGHGPARVGRRRAAPPGRRRARPGPAADHRRPPAYPSPDPQL